MKTYGPFFKCQHMIYNMFSFKLYLLVVVTAVCSFSQGAVFDDVDQIQGLVQQMDLLTRRVGTLEEEKSLLTRKVGILEEENYLLTGLVSPFHLIGIKVGFNGA